MLNLIPYECLYEIMRYLDYKDIINILRLCKHINKIQSKGYFFNYFIRRSIIYFNEKWLRNLQHNNHED